MSGDTVDELILQIEDLRIQEAAVLQRLVAARAREASALNSSRERTPRTRVTAEAGTSNFRIGDRVNITNSIRTPYSRHANAGDRNATVTKITKERVFVRTDNGGTTNRAPGNLRHIVDEAP